MGEGMSQLAGRIYNPPKDDPSDPMLSHRASLQLSDMAHLLVERIKESFTQGVLNFIKEGGEKFVIVTARPSGVGFPPLDLARDLITYNSRTEAEPLRESHEWCRKNFPPVFLSTIEFEGTISGMVNSLRSMADNDPRFGPWVSTLWQRCCSGEATPLDQTPEFLRLNTQGDYYVVARRFRSFRQEVAKSLRAHLEAKTSPSYIFDSLTK